VLPHFNEIILKVIIIASIILMFIVLYVTGITFVLHYDTTYTILLHKLAALFIIALLSVHAWLRRCTIRKLLQESIAILLNKHIRHEDNIDFLIQNTKNSSFKELCTLFNCDVLLLQQKLSENHVNVSTVENTLKTIAKENDKDMYQILLLMIKLHVEASSPSPIYKNSCNIM